MLGTGHVLYIVATRYVVSNSSLTTTYEPRDRLDVPPSPFHSDVASPQVKGAHPKRKAGKKSRLLLLLLITAAPLAACKRRLPDVDPPSGIVLRPRIRRLNFNKASLLCCRQLCLPARLAPTSFAHLSSLGKLNKPRSLAPADVASSSGK